MHRIINTAFGEVLVDVDGDCYVGDNYDQYIGSIQCRNLWTASENSLAQKIESTIMN